MEVKNLESWDEFEVTLNELRANEVSNEKGQRRSKLIFRGQSDAKWDLLTTLERSQAKPMNWQSYLRIVRSTAHHVQTFTDRIWELPSNSQTEKWGKEYDDCWQSIPGYDYWVYLRHHGFPSPLLDWSQSPYVAAFFAFRNESPDRVAIYCYQEYSSGAKGTRWSAPQITVHGPYVSAHRRHVLQQCTYTTCSLYAHGDWTYSKHSGVFDGGAIDQDRLWKITLPATERLTVLRYLDQYNLNAYSLFPTEDALLETVALRELSFRDR